jgi:hypothetical protein
MSSEQTHNDSTDDAFFFEYDDAQSDMFTNEDWETIKVLTDESWAPTDTASVDSSEIENEDLRGGTKRSSRATNGDTIAITSSRRKRQRTEGEPCMLEVCQYPILISNGLNYGNLAAVGQATGKFISENCILTIGEPGKKLEMVGCDHVNDFIEILSGLIPDLTSEISSIKLKRYENVIFRQQLNGTAIFTPSGEPCHPIMQELKQCVGKRLTKSLDKMRKSGLTSDVDMVEVVTNDMLKCGKPVQVRMDLFGSLKFTAEATESLNKSEMPESRRLVHHVDITPSIVYINSRNTVQGLQR